MPDITKTPEAIKAHEELLNSLATMLEKSPKDLVKDLDGVREGLAEILEEVAGVNPDQVSEEKTFTDDLDVDSLSMVEVVVAAEEKFEVKIPDDQVQNLKSVGDAMKFIVIEQTKANA
jgi:acyl carrier protein